MTSAIPATPIQSSIDRFVVASADVRGGRPHINGSRITIGEVAAWRLKMGYTPELIAGKWDLPLAAVYAALAYYYDHKAEIDARQREDDDYAEAVRQATPSPLQEKLGRLQAK